MSNVKNCFDPINNPSHYNEGRAIEPIDVIEDWKLNFHLGSVLKYIARAGRKGSKLQDLKKAAWYLQREIAQMEEKDQIVHLGQGRTT